MPSLVEIGVSKTDVRAVVAWADVSCLKTELAEDGQTDAAWRFIQLQALKQTSADSSQLTADGKPQAASSKR